MTHPHLAHLSTHPSDLRLAHNQPGATARHALERLAERYQPAVRCYLLAAVGDPHAADDLAQEFAVKLARGDFRNFQSDRGRFRDYLRRSLAHLVTDYRRRPALRRLTVEPAGEADPSDPYLPAYRTRLLELAWDGLYRLEVDTGRPLAALLRLLAADPAATSGQLAERVAAAGRAVSAGTVRKWLMEARARFAGLVVAEVAAGVERPTADAVTDELLAVGLYPHCREAVSRRWPGRAG